MGRLRVAIAGCAAAPGAGGLYPDPDWPLLAAALDDAGVEATPLAWDDGDVDWGRFDLAVVRSTWDSVDRPDAYLAWARRAAAATTLLNPLAALEWNLDKSYLQALAARGVPVIPTDWVVDRSAWTPPAHPFVVKPSISGGGRDTARHDAGDDAGDHISRILAGGRTAMVQPYLAGVDAGGEVKLIYLDGTFSHAVQVGPQLTGAGEPGRPWDLAPAVAATPTPAQRAAAERVLAAVDAEVPAPLLYARVDLVPHDGTHLLCEVELVDPSLFLRLAPPAAGRLAAAIRARERTA